MSKPITPRQRAVLKHNLARAIAWSETTAYARGEAERLAEVVLLEMERGYLDAAAQRRAVLAVIEKVDGRMKAEATA